MAGWAWVRAADRHRAFERVTRPDAVRVRTVEGGGVGLGLTIYRQLALRHRGESTAVADNGRRFVVRQPVMAGHDAAS